MSDDVKNVKQNTTSAAQLDQAQPQVQAQPVVSAGSVNKEAGPVNMPDSEVIKPSEVEPEISQELKEAGMEAKSDKPDLTPEHKDLGVEHAGPHVPVSTVSSKPIQYPMSEKEITDKLKTGQDDDSGKWLAGLIRKIIKVIGI